MAETEERFGRGFFASNRPKIMKELTALCDVLRECPVLRLIVDGSFVTTKPEPNDVDLLILFPADFTTPEAHPVAYWTLRRYMLDLKKDARRNELLDVFTFFEGVPASMKKWDNQLAQYLRLKTDPNRPKGILEVHLDQE